MKHIIIDTGHANGTGARGNGQEEHNLCVKVANLLATALRTKGHKVTGIDFPTLSNAADLNKTISKANSLTDVSLGISLHMDASDNKSARGGHVCYISTSGQKAAEAIASELCLYMPGRAQKTVRRTNLGVLKRTKWRWVLIELGFITSLIDIKKLMDDPATPENELKPLIDALVRGIEKAL